MQTINTNSASMLSTADLRNLLVRYENPTTMLEGLILKGIQAQMEENEGLRDRQGNIMEDKIKELEDENEYLERCKGELEEEIEELEKKA